MSTKTLFYLLALLLFSLTSLLATASALPAKDSDTTTQESEFASVNGKIIPLTIPIYERSEDGKSFTLRDGVESNGRLECQTSSGSPYVWDISDAANKVRHSGSMCFQDNPGGSKCKSHASHGTAALGLCGTVMLGAKCHSLAWVADRIIEHCRSGDQAGGQYYYDSTAGWLKGIVYRN